MAKTSWPMIPKKRSEMAEPQHLVRSAKARDLAHRLARRENRSIADVVVGRLSRTRFVKRGGSLRPLGTDIDLDDVIRDGREAIRSHVGFLKRSQSIEHFQGPRASPTVKS
jgi:hypothetical protein